MRRIQCQNGHTSIVHKILPGYNSLEKVDKVLVGIAVGFSIWLLCFVLAAKLILNTFEVENHQIPPQKKEIIMESDKWRSQSNVSKTIAGMNENFNQRAREFEKRRLEFENNFDQAQAAFKKGVEQQRKRNKDSGKWMRDALPFFKDDQILSEKSSFKTKKEKNLSPGDEN